MFDITNYNIYTAFTTFVIVFALLFFLFRKKSIGVVDPLTYHLLWIAGNIAFLIAYIERYGIEYVAVLFLMVFMCYTFFILYFFKPIKIDKELPPLNLKKKNTKVFILYFLSLLLILYSKKPAFDFIMNNNPIAWFLYRYKAIEGGQAFYRILDLGVTPIFLYLTFYIFYIIKKYRFFISIVLMFFILLLILIGGRSSLLMLLFSFGGFIAFHRESILTQQKKKRINYFSFVFVIVAIAVAVFVSAMFEQSYSAEKGINTILNRVIASADGLEYYMKYDGFEKIGSGAYEYFMSIFSVYIKSFLGVDYKNVGHQLTELATGMRLDFAQGSNYTLPLQVMVFNYSLMPIYILAVGLIVVKMRNIHNSKNNKINILGFFIFSVSFGIVTDIEFFTLRLISFFTIYFLLFYPILKIKI